MRGVPGRGKKRAGYALVTQRLVYRDASAGQFVGVESLAQTPQKRLIINPSIDTSFPLVRTFRVTVPVR
jgi:hypothetical protein